MKEKYPYRPAILVHHENNLAKRWYVDFAAWDVSKEKLVRVRMYDPLNREKNLYKRLQLGDNLVRVINGRQMPG